MLKFKYYAFFKNKMTINSPIYLNKKYYYNFIEKYSVYN